MKAITTGILGGLALPMVVAACTPGFPSRFDSRGSAPASPVAATAEDGTSQAPARVRGRLAPWGAKGYGRRLLVSDTTVWLSVQWRSETIGHEVQLLHRERSGLEEPFVERVYTFTTPFAVHRVTGMHMGHLLVDGRTADGQQVLEWWRLSWPAGTPALGRHPAATGVGVPHASVPTARFVVGGEPVVPFEERLLEPRTERIQLHRGPALGDWMFGVIDPEGRFVLALTKDGPSASHAGSDARLLRWTVADGVASGPDLLMDAAGTPELRGATSMVVRDHLSLGRIYNINLNSLGPERRLILVDRDNDGVMDAVLPLTPSEAESLAIPGGYLDDFIRSPWSD